MQDGEWFAPVALPTEQPIAQFVVDASAAQTALLKPCYDAAFELGCGQPVEGTGVNRRPLAYKRIMDLTVLCIGQGGFVLARLIALWRLHHVTDRQIESTGKLPITQVMCRHSHDRSSAVAS